MSLGVEPHVVLRLQGIRCSGVGNEDLSETESVEAEWYAENRGQNEKQRSKISGEERVQGISYDLEEGNETNNKQIHDRDR